MTFKAGRRHKHFRKSRKDNQLVNFKETGRKMGQKKKSWGELTLFFLYLEISLLL
jgi:hypothetical protein